VSNREQVPMGTFRSSRLDSKGVGRSFCFFFEKEDISQTTGQIPIRFIYERIIII